MKHIQKLIPYAIEAVNIKQICNSKNQVPTEFNGYISSFGASIISSGLLPSVIFYSQKKNASEDRPNTIKAVEYIIQKDSSNPAFNLLEEVKTLYSGKPINQDKVRLLTTRVENALIALKLAIRIFEPIKKEES